MIFAHRAEQLQPDRQATIHPRRKQPRSARDWNAVKPATLFAWHFTCCIGMVHAAGMIYTRDGPKTARLPGSGQRRLHRRAGGCPPVGNVSGQGRRV